MKFLSAKQKKFYEDNGYVVADVFTEEEIEELSLEYDAIFKRKNDENLEATWQGDWKKEDSKSVRTVDLKLSNELNLTFSFHDYIIVLRFLNNYD